MVAAKCLGDRQISNPKSACERGIHEMTGTVCFHTTKVTRQSRQAGSVHSYSVSMQTLPLLVLRRLQHRTSPLQRRRSLKFRLRLDSLSPSTIGSLVGDRAMQYRRSADDNGQACYVPSSSVPESGVCRNWYSSTCTTFMKRTGVPHNILTPQKATGARG